MGREAKRVPLDFDYPLDEKWAGYLNPYLEYCESCQACEGSGYSPEALRFKKQWYGQEPFDPLLYGARPIRIDDPVIRQIAERNVDASPVFYKVHLRGREHAIQVEVHRLYTTCFAGHWSHHLIQADVDALIAAERLTDLTHRWDGKQWVPLDPMPVITAEMVNAWGRTGHGPDVYTCIKARCEREGVPHLCSACNGDGEIWPSRAHKALYESWKKTDPPTGDGWQLWETTSEGSPISPVFATAEELAAWCEGNATTFANCRASKEQWLKMIDKDLILHREGNVIFM